MDSVGLEGWEEINMKLISHGFRRAGEFLPILQALLNP
jgi:hypothetical protein